MRNLAKLAFGALALAALSFGAAEPANAATSFGFGFSTGPGPVRDPCFRPYYARPAYCRYPMSHGQVFFGGAWHYGPFHYRFHRGYREYWHQGGWRRGHFHYMPPPPRRGWR